MSTRYGARESKFGVAGARRAVMGSNVVADDDSSLSSASACGSGDVVSVSDEVMDTKEDGSSASATKQPEATASVSPSLSSLAKPSGPNPNTVIMFDWDDTLLASSFLSGLGYRLDSAPPSPTNAPEVDNQLRLLERCVVSVLTLAMTYGHVNIVTNAETGWVQLSAQKFMPAVVPLLSKVTVISARSTFEPAHPDAPLKWKFYAFHERLSSVFGGSGPSGASSPAGTTSAWWSPAADALAKNIVSFGDSHVEREAIRAVTRGVIGCRCKSVKFAERPTPEQLRRQLELVTNCFHYIHNHEADLDLQLTVTLNTSPQPTSPVSPPHSASPDTHSPPALATTEVA